MSSRDTAIHLFKSVHVPRVVNCFDENELVNNLGHIARCCTKAVIEAMSASDQSELVHTRPIWFHQGTCGQQENSRWAVHLRIGGWLLTPKSTVLSKISFSPSRFKNIPRASSSCAGRPRQVATDRALAGDKFWWPTFRPVCL